VERLTWDEGRFDDGKIGLVIEVIKRDELDLPGAILEKALIRRLIRGATCRNIESALVAGSLKPGENVTSHLNQLVNFAFIRYLLMILPNRVR